MPGLLIVIKNFFSLSIGEFFSRIAGIFLFIILARYLGPEKYGIYSIAVSFVTIFMLVSNFGLDAIIMKDVSRNHNLLNSYFFSALFVKSGVSILCILLIVIILNFFNYDSLTNQAVLTYSLVVLFASNLNTSISIFNAFEKMKFSAITNIIRSFSSFFIIGLLILFQSNLLTIIISQPVVYFLVFIVTIFILSAEFTKVNFIFDRQTIYYFLKTSWPYFLTGVIHIINFKVDILMLSNFTNEKTVGYYAAANDLVVSLLVLPNLFATAFFPNMSKKYGEGALEKLKKESEFSLRFLTVIGILSGLFFFIFSNFIIQTVYGSEFKASAYLLKILSFIITLTFAKVILSWLLTAMENIKLSMTEYLICLISNIILNAVLIPKYGATGSALATLTSYIVGYIFLFVVLKIKLSGNSYHFNYIKVIAILPVVFFSLNYFSFMNNILLLLINTTLIIIYLIVFKIVKLDEMTKLIRLK